MAAAPINSNITAMNHSKEVVLGFLPVPQFAQFPVYDGAAPLSWSEILIDPLVRDMNLIIPCVMMWFVIQYSTAPILRKLLPGTFAKLSQKDQMDFAIRMCAVINGLISINGAYTFFTTPKDDRHYYPIPQFAPTRVIIMTYFMWDVFVCFAYNWDMAWKFHAICSVLGTWFLNFPVSDAYQCSFNGVFEMSNAFVHIAQMLRMLDTTKKSPTHAKTIALMEYTFAALFFFIRVLMGTWISHFWTSEMVSLMLSGKAHSTFTITACLCMLWPMMVLQYYWFWKIFKVGMGWESADAASDDDKAADEKKQQ